MDKIKKRINIYNSVILIILGICTIISCRRIPSHEGIYGVWKGELQGKELLFKFEIDQTCVLSFRNKASDSVETINGNFKMDFSKKPITLSVKNIPGLNHPLHTIVEFEGINLIKLANFSPRWKIRPISFDPNKSMNLKRVK